MGIINLSEQDMNIQEITGHRPIAAIPIAGRYRIIDFALSNMVNGGITNIAVYPQGKTRALMDHVGTGAYWDLDRKRGGLAILNPTIDNRDVVQKRGDIETFKNHLDFLYNSPEKYVLMSRSYMLANIDFDPAFDFHKESGADVTILYKHMENNVRRFINCDTLNLDDKNNVISIGKNLGKQKYYDISMEMYLMKKELLINLIEEGVHRGDADYLKQCLFNRIDELKFNGFLYEGYLSCVNSIDNYYATNMELLNPKKAKKLFGEYGSIYTKIKDETSTLYTDTAHVTNSLLANGSVIEGTVENCIIGRGVKIKKGAIVRNSIIMQNCTIDETANLNYAILDKNVVVSKKKMLFGHEGNPFVIRKNATI